MAAGVTVEQSRFMDADEVAHVLGCSRTTAYRIIKQLNEQLRKDGKITLAGKVSRRYFEQRVAL